MGIEKFSNNKMNVVPEDYIEINDENILMEFAIDNNNYCVLGNFNNDDELIYFAKMDIDEDGNDIIKSIDDEEYDKVVNYYDSIISSMEDSNE